MPPPAERASGAGQGRSVRIIEVVVDGDRYGFPLDTVAEVISLRRGGATGSMPEPGAPGSAALERDPVELRVLLGGSPGQFPGKLALLLEGADGVRAVSVDEVRGVRTIPATDIHSPPACFSSRTRDVVSGIAEADRSLLVLLRPEALERLAEGSLSSASE
jgi:hypothetical protein